MCVHAVVVCAVRMRHGGQCAQCTWAFLADFLSLARVYPAVFPVTPAFVSLPFFCFFFCFLPDLWPWCLGSLRGLPGVPGGGVYVWWRRGPCRRTRGTRRGAAWAVCGPRGAATHVTKKDDFEDPLKLIINFCRVRGIIVFWTSAS